MGCCSHSINGRQFTISCFLQNSFYSLSEALILLATKKGCVYNRLEPKFCVYPVQYGINFLLLLFYKQKLSIRNNESTTKRDILGPRNTTSPYESIYHTKSSEPNLRWTPMVSSLSAGERQNTKSWWNFFIKLSITFARVKGTLSNAVQASFMRGIVKGRIPSDSCHNKKFRINIYCLGN